MEWFRDALIDAHRNQRNHLEWIIGGLSEEHMTRRISEEEQIYSILSILRHICNAETYWFHKNGHSIGLPISSDNVEEVKAKLKQNTKKIEEAIRTCGIDQLQIIAGSKTKPPSIAWAVLRTYQHGIYHSGQISKIRHIIGAPSVKEDGEYRWEKAVDSIIEIIHKFISGKN
jgi:uncharacterized damage-inducible protein DinB